MNKSFHSFLNIFTDGPTTPEIYCGQHLITNQTVDVIDGHDLSLKCSASGDPEPQYTWDGNPGKSISVNITRDDMNYSCNAINKLQPDYGNERSMSASSVVYVKRLCEFWFLIMFYLFNPYPAGHRLIIDDYTNRFPNWLIGIGWGNVGRNK